MAGGIDWYRAHHGTVEDPKLGLVAQCAGQRRGDVIAMWHYLMEKASAADDRGNPGQPHFRSLDFLLQMEPGGAERIYAELIAEGLVDGTSGRLTAWDRRQPKRERPDDNSTERTRKHRNATERHGTPEQQGNASDGSGTPREEESREEKNSSLRSEKTQRKRSASTPPQLISVDDMAAEGVDPAHARDWLKARGKHPLTPTAWELLKDEADKAGITPARAVEICAAKSWRGFDSTWDWPGKRAGAPPGSATPNRQEALELRNRAAAAEWAERKQRQMEDANAPQ